MDGGADPRVIKTFEKVNNILMKAYENKEEPWPGKMKYRAIVWSCPAHYYANFSNWLANCWGVNVLVEMESLNFTKPLETEDKEEALRDLARLYERMVMRRHTNGGYQNVVDELWRQCEDWNAKLIIMYQNVACKNMATVQGVLDDQGRERGYDLIWVEHDLMDPRTVSPPHHARQGQRVHAHRHEGGACRSVSGRVRGRGLHVIAKAHSVISAIPVKKGFRASPEALEIIQSYKEN